MKGIVASLCGVAIVLVLVIGVYAEDKETTLAGKITCAKCELKVKEFVDKKKCATVIVVKDGDKDVIYYFDEKAHKAHHSKVCQEGKEGTVVGVVLEKDKKKIIGKVSKVEFKE